MRTHCFFPLLLTFSCGVLFLDPKWENIYIIFHNKNKSKEHWFFSIYLWQPHPKKLTVISLSLSLSYFPQFSVVLHNFAAGDCFIHVKSMS